MNVSDFGLILIWLLGVMARFFSDSFLSMSRPDWAPSRVVSNAGSRLQLAGARASHPRLSGVALTGDSLHHGEREL